MEEVKQSLDKLWSLSRIDNYEIKMLGGVCAGIAYSFSLAPWIVRLVFALSAIFSFGTTLLIYLVLWLVLPKITVDKASFERRVSSHTVSAVVVEKPNVVYPHAEKESSENVIITPYNPTGSEKIEDAHIKPSQDKNSLS